MTEQTGKEFEKLKNLIPYETTQHVAKHDSSYLERLKNIPVVKRSLEIAKQSAGQDTLTDEVAYLDKIIQPRKPDLVMRMIPNMMFSTEPTQQFGAFTRGKAQRSARGEQGFTSRAGRFEKRKIDLQITAENRETLDQEFIEDMSASVIPNYMQSLSYEHDQIVDSDILAEIMKVTDAAAGDTSTTTFTDSAGNVHKRGPFKTTTVDANWATTAVDYLLTAKKKAKKYHIHPNAVLINTDLECEMLKNNHFKSLDYFREYADYRMGTIRGILGLDIFVTDQRFLKADDGTDISSKTAIMFEKENFLYMFMRRDKMMTSFQHRETLETGLSYSSRYGFAFGDTSRCVVMTS